MAFKRVDKQNRPPRRWALKGYYSDGKSTFITAMRQPTLMIDADGRRNELRRGELYELSGEAADHRSVERIQDLLEENMAGSGIETIAIDSVTSLIGTSIARAMLDNAAERNRNRNQAWVDKAEKMRLLQDAVTGYGTDVLWIWHLEDGQLNGQHQTRETLPETERERLFRSLNAALRIVREGDRRGVLIEWSREGPAGMIVWDDEGFWQGVPEKVEAIIYDSRDQGAPPPATTGQANLARVSPAHANTPRIVPVRPARAPATQVSAAPVDAPAAIEPDEDEASEARHSSRDITFNSPAEALGWGVDQGAFIDHDSAQEAYETLKAERQPRKAREMYAAWVDLVQSRTEAPHRRRA